MGSTAVSRLFQALCGEAATCRRCVRFADRQAVLGPACGTLRPKVLFIGEAPGRQGADRTRVPFSGDASGRTFETLLAHAGLTRDEIFITNAVLCCPADQRRNRAPSAAEIRNCLPYLAATIDLLRPRVIATIGAVALRAVSMLAGRRLQLADSVGRRIPLSVTASLNRPIPRLSLALRMTRSAVARHCRAKQAVAAEEAHSLALGVRKEARSLAFGVRKETSALAFGDTFTLVPLYHPSPRVVNTIRSLRQQRIDFAAVAQAIGAKH